MTEPLGTRAGGLLRPASFFAPAGHCRVVYIMGPKEGRQEEWI